MKVRFDLSSTGVERLMDELLPVRERAAEAIVNRAEQIAPVTTGDYRASLGTDGTKAGSSDPFAHLIEFGSLNNAPHRVLSRAASDVGLTFRDDG